MYVCVCVRVRAPVRTSVSVSMSEYFVTNLIRQLSKLGVKRLNEMSRQYGDFSIINQLGDDGGVSRTATMQRLFALGDKSIPVQWSRERKYVNQREEEEEEE